MWWGARARRWRGGTGGAWLGSVAGGGSRCVGCAGPPGKPFAAWMWLCPRLLPRSTCGLERGPALLSWGPSLVLRWLPQDGARVPAVPALCCASSSLLRGSSAGTSSWGWCRSPGLSPARGCCAPLGLLGSKLSSYPKSYFNGNVGMERVKQSN